jgi:hypothetical protein
MNPLKVVLIVSTVLGGLSIGAYKIDQKGMLLSNLATQKVSLKDGSVHQGRGHVYHGIRGGK